MAGSYTVGVAIRYVLPILWMTSCLRIIPGIGDAKRRILNVTRRHILKLIHQGAAQDRGGVCHPRLSGWSYAESRARHVDLYFVL